MSRRADANPAEESPMMLNTRLIRRSAIQAAVIALPTMLAGCSHLFPHRGAATPAAAPATAAPAMSKAESKKAAQTLYARLGGDPALNAFTDDFLGRVTNDPAIIPFFKGLTQDDLKRIRQHVFELLCSATGGPCKYTGKDMKTTHKDLEITNDTWNRFTGHLNATVTRLQIQDRERNELVAIIASLKPDIVNK
jgi:hemoglobin